MIKIFILTISAFSFLFLGMGLKMWLSGEAQPKGCSCSFGGKESKSSCCGGKSEKRLIQIKKL